MRKMSVLFVVLLFVMLSGSGHAQQSPSPSAPPPDLTRAMYLSAADAAAAVAGNAGKQGTNANALTTIFKFGPYTLYIEHRIPVTQVAAIHDKEAELF